MSSVQKSINANLSTHAPTLELDEIQATVLRQRPAPYYGTHMLLRVDDAGHDQWGATKLQLYALRADQLAFLLWQLRDR